MDNMTTNNENKSGTSIGLDQLLPEDNKSVQLELNYGQNECNSQRVLKENNKREQSVLEKNGQAVLCTQRSVCHCGYGNAVCYPW